MRILCTLCFICYLSFVRADEASIHVHRAPTIQFLYDGMKVYTDTASLFHILGTEGSPYRNTRVYDLVLRRLKQSKSDTVTFAGLSIPYDDSLGTVTSSDYFAEWYPYWDLLQLLKERHAVFIDRKGVLVKHYNTHKEGSKALMHIARIYTNRANHEWLFSECLYHVMICPKF